MMATSVLHDSIENMYLLINAVSYVPHTTQIPQKPYLEVGDTIQFPIGENTVSSFILQRTMNGLTKDKLEAKGEEYHDKQYIVESE